MFRTALRNVLAHKARLMMTALAVLLGVAFVSGTLVFTSTVSSAYESSKQGGLAGVDAAVRPSSATGGTPGARPGLAQHLLGQAARTPGAASAAGSVSGFAALAGKDGKPVGEGFRSSGANYSPGPDGKDARYPLRNGRAPAREGEVALDARTAGKAGFAVGDTVRLSVDGPVREARITGIFTTDEGTVNAGGSLVLFDTATAQKLYGLPGKFAEIAVKAAPGTSQEALRAALEKALPDGVDVLTGRQLAAERAQANARSLDKMQAVLLGFAGIALFVGVFVIANTFTMLVAQRTKELALMRAVGASRRQVTRSVLVEALLVGTVAGAAGLLVGVGIGAAARALLRGSGAAVPDGPLTVTPGTVVTSLAVGILVTMLAAWLPGRRAAKVPPVAAMTSVHAPVAATSLVVRNAVGAVLAAAGAVCLPASTAQGSDGKDLLVWGAAALVVGVLVLTPLLSRVLITAAGPVLRRFGTPGVLAGRNAVRNPRRTASTASALMIGLALVTGLTVIAGSVQQAVDKLATDSMKADYMVSMANNTLLSPDVAKKIESLPDVTASSPQRLATTRIDGERRTLTGVDTRTIGQLGTFDFTAGSFAELGRDTVVLDEPTARRHGWKRGSRLHTTFEDGRTATLTVAGIYRENKLMGGVMVDARTLVPHGTQATDRAVLVKTRAGTGDAAKDALRKALGDNPVLKIQDRQDISQEAAGTIDLVLNVLYALLAMAVVVAVLGVVNTLAMSVFERSQEIGTLRALGLDRSGVRHMVRLESLVISLFAGLSGTTLGVFFAWSAGAQIRPDFPTYELVVPWGRLGVFVLLSAVVGMLASIWPARRAAKLSPLEAIAE
ncbi:ABC transporter permease [Streptomyces rimosus]|uniref:ABC transporter permease n=1 Tax=Streptomyces rimosus TaxID=1927 RepID=UPI0004C7E63D|nr:ABC transporter permease [Streptomyces rimosus]